MNPNLLVSVELNQPSKLSQLQKLPRKKFSDIPVLSRPWFLIVLKILTVIIKPLCSIYLGRETIKVWEGVLGFLVSSLCIWLFVEFVSIIFSICTVTIKDKEEFTVCSTIDAVLISIKGLTIICELCCFIIGRTITWSSVAVFVGYIAIDVFLMRRYFNYYTEQIKDLEDGLIEDLKNKFGHDHNLGIAVHGYFGRFSPNVELKFWEGVPSSSRHSSAPSKLFSSKMKDNSTEYFVSWDEYREVSGECKENYKRMVELAAKCEELRTDLNIQNDLITQCRQRLFGSKADLSDIKKVPSKTPTYASWRQQKVEGIFTTSKEFMKLYVKMEDYRELAQHAALVSKSVPSLEEEKALLKEALKKRKIINNSLMVKMLLGNFKNEANLVQVWINDVD